MNYTTSGLLYSKLNPDEKRLLRTESPCVICGCSDFDMLVVDHDHETDLVRGVLCGQCNGRVGRVETIPLEWMKKAEGYVQKPQFYKALEIVEHRYRQHNQEWLKELDELENSRATLLASLQKAEERMAKIKTLVPLA